MPVVQHYYSLDYVYEQWMCLDVTVVDIETVMIDEQSPICNYMQSPSNVLAPESRSPRLG